MDRKRTSLMLAIALIIICAGLVVTCFQNFRAWADPDPGRALDGMTSSELRDESDSVREKIPSMQLEADEASDAYFKAIEEKEAAEEASRSAQRRIENANRRIAELYADLDSRAVELYKNGDSLDGVQMLLEADSIEEFASTWHYLTCLANRDTEMIAEIEGLKESIVKEKMYADEQADVAQAKAAEAERIRVETEKKIAEYEQYLVTLDEKTRAKAEEEARAAAIAAAAENRSVKYSGSTSIPANGSVVDYAYSRLGCPYVWAASGPDSFDCSGLVMWCYAQVGEDLPHYTEALYSEAKAVLPLSAAQPGDVLYMPGHVGICIEAGGGAYIHAPTPGDVVRVSTWPMFTCALRF